MFVAQCRVGVAVVGRLMMAVVAMLVSSGITHAGAIVIDEAGVNAIFSQPSFGDTPISIRFNPARTIVAPEFLVINTMEDLQALYSLAPDPAPTVVAFFVDIINECQTVEVTEDGKYFGCAQKPGNLMVLNSTMAALEPAKLISHEIGHNFSLEHTSLGLMTAHLGFGGTELFDDQIEDILKSPLVQVDANGQRFIQISPIAIVDTPEPSSLLLLSGGLGALLIIKRRKSVGLRR